VAWLFKPVLELYDFKMNLIFVYGFLREYGNISSIWNEIPINSKASKICFSLNANGIRQEI